MEPTGRFTFWPLVLNPAKETMWPHPEVYRFRRQLLYNCPIIHQGDCPRANLSTLGDATGEGQRNQNFMGTKPRVPTQT